MEDFYKKIILIYVIFMYFRGDFANYGIYKKQIRDIKYNKVYEN